MIPQEPLPSTCILFRLFGVVVELFIPIEAPAPAEAPRELPQSRTGRTGARSAATRQRWPTQPPRRKGRWLGWQVRGGRLTWHSLGMKICIVPIGSMTRLICILFVAGLFETSTAPNQFPVPQWQHRVIFIFVFHPCCPGLVRAANGRASGAKAHRGCSSCNGRLCPT